MHMENYTQVLTTFVGLRVGYEGEKNWGPCPEIGVEKKWGFSPFPTFFQPFWFSFSKRKGRRVENSLGNSPFGRHSFHDLVTSRAKPGGWVQDIHCNLCCQVIASSFISGSRHYHNVDTFLLLPLSPFNVLYPLPHRNNPRGMYGSDYFCDKWPMTWNFRTFPILFVCVLNYFLHVKSISFGWRKHKFFSSTFYDSNCCYGHFFYWYGESISILYFCLGFIYLTFLQPNDLSGGKKSDTAPIFVEAPFSSWSEVSTKWKTFFLSRFFWYPNVHVGRDPS